MNNTYLTYLEWRGDLPIDAYPFNDIDNFILSELSYFDFNNIVPESGEAITLQAAYAKLKILHEKEKKAGLFCSSIATLEKIAHSKRFANMKLSYYTSIFDDEKIQFAALKISLNHRMNYISFRGTDDTLAGWKEDFSISFEIVPSQKAAVLYLNKIIEKGKLNMVGGHSKGGNLAVYSSMMCENDCKSSITSIYSNDGPGLCQELIDKNQYALIKHKIIKIVPEFSVVGLLFEDSEHMKVVKSSANGILQHDMTTWQVSATGIKKGVLTEQALVCKTIIDEWMSEVELKHRKLFVDDFFKALRVKGARTLTDLANQGTAAFQDILSSMVFSHRTSKWVFFTLLKSAFSRFIHIDYVALFRSKEMLLPMLIFFLGLSFVIIPVLAQKVIGTIVLIGLLSYSICQLYKLKKDYDKNHVMSKFRLCMYSIIILIELFCMIQNRIIVFSTNMILGIFLIYRGYVEIKRSILIRHTRSWKWTFYFINAILLELLGVVALTSTSEVFEGYVVSVGSYLLIWGTIEIIKIVNHTTILALKKQKM